MLGFVGKGLASLSLSLRQSITAFCDIETAVGDHLVTKRGAYVTLVRMHGLCRMTMRADVERISEILRMELSTSFEGPGHAIQAWFTCDPSLAGAEIERNLEGCRVMAEGHNADLSDIFAERSRIWPRMMRSEACYFGLWTKKSVMTREEAKQAGAEQAAAGRGAPSVGDAQNPFRLNEILATRHEAFVRRVISAFQTQEVSVERVKPDQALVTIREALYPETTGSGWTPSLPGCDVRPMLPEDGEKGDAGLLLWPPVADQIFRADAVTNGGQRVEIGEHEWAPVDMTRGPEDAKPFSDLMARMAESHVPWRMLMLVESGGQNMMWMKKLGASVLAFSQGARDVRNAFDALQMMRNNQTDVAVKLRTSFATWAPVGQTPRLRRQASTLAQGIETWGNCQAGTISGDPLEGTMSTVPGLALGSTAPAAAAPLADVLRMMPWSRPTSPWSQGSVLFRSPDGRMFPYDPTGSKRTHTVDLFVGPSRYGKSVLSNTILLGLCLSSAAQTSRGVRFPLIGKLDIGPSAKGLVTMLRDALPEHLRHLALYVGMQLQPGYEFNVFDTQLGCRTPLPLEREFLLNFLSLGCLPIGSNVPFEGMSHLVGFVVDEAYRMFADAGPNVTPKSYQRGLEPTVDLALRRHGIMLHEEEPVWWEVVDELCRVQEWSLAERAQRHAMPLLQDLMSVVRVNKVRDMFKAVKAGTEENVPELFERYITALIKQYPTLNKPTTLDFGLARVIVLDLEGVAPTGSPDADRQTELMYLLGRHILAKNFFLRPKYIPMMPDLVLEYHRHRITEFYETLKRLEYDEYHRTSGSPYVRAQVELDRREGAKHNLHLGLSSQKLDDFGDDLIGQSTGRFICGAGDEPEKEAIIRRFRLSPASAQVVRTRLNGPMRDGSGAPFMAIMNVNNVVYEQMLVNSLGPVELWALSTTPNDVALRNRLYERVGPVEARKRLARVFPKGTARDEIDRRKDERLKRGQGDVNAEASVIETLTDELTDGRGLGLMLRRFAVADRDASTMNEAAE